MPNERSLAVLIVLLAAALRLLWLDTPPFSSAEAERGLTALALVRGHEPALWDAPALHTVSAAVALLFGASETALRAAPALAGTAAVGLVWLFRPWLGAVPTLTAQLLLAVSPSLAAYSRTLGPEALAQPLLVVLVWAVLRATVSGSAAAFITAAVCVGVLLNLGPAAVSCLAALAVALALAWALGGRVPDLRAHMPEAAVSLLIAFTLAATGMLVFPAGFGLPAVAAWVAAFEPDASGAPWMLGLLKLAVYEPAALAAGLLTAMSAMRRDGPAAPLLRALAVWAIGGAVLAAAHGDRGGWTLLPAVLPLTLLAGAGLGKLLAGLDRAALVRAAVAAPLPAVVLAYVGLALTRHPAPGPDSILAIGVGLAGLAAAAAFALFQSQETRVVPPPALAVLALGLIILLDVHGTARLAFIGGSAEWFDGPRPSPFVQAELDRLRLLPAGASPTLTEAASLAVAQDTGPLVRWHLRDRAAVTYVEQLGPGPSLLLGLRPGEGRPDVRGYGVREFPLEARWRPAEITPVRLWRWYALRETFGPAPQERRAVMYWRL